MLSNRGKWIWINTSAQKNEYALFEGEFPFTSGEIMFKICAETDYILYINGILASFGQFAGYPFEKYYDEIDITSLCRAGENTFSVSVRYEGVNSATHIDDGAGVIFSIENDGDVVKYSDKTIRAGYDEGYVQHTSQKITAQLGLSSTMRFCKGRAQGTAVEIEKTYNIKKRPVKKSSLMPLVIGSLLDNKKRIYDLGREEAGYIYLKARANKPQKIKVAYGEHVADGEVRYKISDRDFSLDFELSLGECELTQLFVRVSARYLQIIAEDEVEILSIGILPLRYPLTERETNLTGLDKKIYDTSVRTLRLCIGSHYEDCPWREQAMYVLDSRNQMLCGYYAFLETELQRESLIFISKGVRKDGFLELTYPAINTPAIPFFSLMYPVSVYEYIKHTGDKSILDEVMDTMRTIMLNFKERVDENGLIAELEPPFWNFYEWSKGSCGEIYRSDEKGQKRCYHLILNCAYVYSSTLFEELCKMAGTSIELDTEATRNAIKREMFNEENGLFYLRTDDKSIYSQLGNAFALLIGLGDERTVKGVKERKSLIPATLSMLSFVYDSLLLRNEGAEEYILNDIREKYGYMLSCGASSFWETIEGEKAFDGAGSLCHGWSALPVYYYNILKND